MPSLQDQRFPGKPDGNLSLGGQGIPADGIQCLDEGGDVAADVEEEVVDDVGGEDDLAVCGKFFHDETAGVVVGDVDPGHEPPEEAGDEMVVNGGKFPGWVEAGDGDGASGLVEVVEELPELDPHRLLVRDEVEVVNQQCRSVAEPLGQLRHRLGRVFSSVHLIHILEGDAGNRREPGSCAEVCSNRHEKVGLP